MVKSRIFIEGGGNSKELKVECRKAFRQLFEKAGLVRRLPGLVACGGRDDTFADFKTAHGQAAGDAYVAMLVDSEEPMAGPTPWHHLQRRDDWQKPAGATDDQVLLMVTCMETWIVADRESLADHYGADRLQVSRLPSLQNLETKPRQVVQGALEAATRESAKAYRKGILSYAALACADPADLARHLPNFQRCLQVLDRNCPSAD